MDLSLSNKFNSKKDKKLFNRYDKINKNIDMIYNKIS